MELNILPVSLFDTLIALSFIISGLIGLMLYFVRFRSRSIKSKVEVGERHIVLPIFNTFFDSPIQTGDVLFLRQGIITKRRSIPKSGRIKFLYPAKCFDEIHFTSPGFQPQKWQGNALPENIHLVPHLPPLSRRLTRVVLRWLRGTEIGLLLVGTLFIPLSSSSSMFILLLASISLWILHLRRLSQPRLLLQVVDAKTGLGVKYATVLLHRPTRSQEIISDRSGQVWVDLPLPSTFSVACHGYHIVKNEIIPATAVAHDGIYIPMHSR